MSEIDQAPHDHHASNQASQRERAPQVILWGTLGLVLFAVLSLGLWSIVYQEPVTELLFSRSSPKLPVYGVVPDFHLVERSHQPIQRTDLWGKIWVVAFIFTHCPDECPLMTAEIARLQSDMAHMEDFRTVSITVDPERDTPGVLGQYAERFGADPERWLFLTGEQQAIYQLAREGFRLGVVAPGASLQPGANSFMLPAAARTPPQEHLAPPRHWLISSPQILASYRPSFLSTPAYADHGGHRTPLHSTRFVLVDRQAQIRGYYDSLDQAQLQRLREHIQMIRRET